MKIMSLILIVLVVMVGGILIAKDPKLTAKADDTFIGRWMNVGGGVNSIKSGDSVWVEAYCDSQTGNLIYLTQGYRGEIAIAVVKDGCPKN